MITFKEYLAEIAIKGKAVASEDLNLEHFKTQEEYLEVRGAKTILYKGEPIEDVIEQAWKFLRANQTSKMQSRNSWNFVYYGYLKSEDKIIIGMDAWPKTGNKNAANAVILDYNGKEFKVKKDISFSGFGFYNFKQNSGLIEKLRQDYSKQNIIDL